MIMNRNSFYMCMLVCTIFMYSCQTKDNVIVIGAILPLSGDVAIYGNNTKKGIDLAVQQVNQLGGIDGMQIQVIYEDSRANPREGVSAMQKLISVHDVQYVIDNSVSSVALAMVPVAEKNNVVLLSTGSTNPKLSGISPWFFRIWNSDSFEGKFTANYAYDSLQLNSFSIIYVNNDYGISLKDVFIAEFEAKGGNVLSEEAFEQNDTDFRTQLAKIKNVTPEGLYIVGYSKEISNLLIQTDQFQISSKLLGTVTMEDRQVIDLALSSAEGVIYPFPKEPDPNHPSVSTFQQTYLDTYNEKHGITCDVGYDAIMLLREAVILGEGITSEKIANGLRRIENYNGASGLINFDQNGDVSKPLDMKIIENGEFRVLN